MVDYATTGQDAASGIATCTTGTYQGPDSATATVTGTCTDNAGNVSAPVSLAFQYNATLPAVNVTLARSPDDNGWYNHPLGYAGSGSAASGIDACTSGIYSGPDSASATLSATCTSTSGLSATASKAIAYDSTSPTITYSGNAGSYAVNQTVAISCAAVDPSPGSGLASSTCADINGPAYTYGLGSHTFSASATDGAGNTGNGSTSFTVSVTPGGLCLLTRQFIQTSARYQALTPTQKMAVDQLATALCGYLTQISPILTSRQKSALISLYKQGVAALVPAGWLTATQAQILSNLASSL
jgi:hypothetical protein